MSPIHTFHTESTKAPPENKKKNKLTTAILTSPAPSEGTGGLAEMTNPFLITNCWVFFERSLRWYLLNKNADVAARRQRTMPPMTPPIMVPIRRVDEEDLYRGGEISILGGWRGGNALRLYSTSSVSVSVSGSLSLDEDRMLIQQLQ